MADRQPLPKSAIGWTVASLFIVGYGLLLVANAGPDSSEPASPSPVPTVTETVTVTEVETKEVQIPLPQVCKDAALELDAAVNSLNDVSTDAGRLETLTQEFERQVWTYDHTGAADTQELINDVAGQLGDSGIAATVARTKAADLVAECIEQTS